MFVPVLCGAAFKNKGVQALLDAVIDYLPGPLDVPAIKGHMPGARARRFVERTPIDDEPFAALAFKIMTDPFVGRLTFFRVYSGRLAAGSYVYNASKDKRERVARLLQMHANKREEIDEVLAGDIARGHRAQGHADRRHALRRERSDHPRGDDVPGAGDLEWPSSPRRRPTRTSSRSRCRSSPKRIRPSGSARDPETGQTIIAGMGELHLEILVDRMRREFKVEANVGRPQVAYRETIRKRVEKVEGKFIRQSGGKGQYGHVVINLEPGEPGKGFVFVDKIVGGVGAARVHQAGRSGHARGAGERRAGRVSDGRREGRADLRLLPRGGLERNGVQDRRLDGVKEAARKAQPVMLEPIMDVEVVTPEDYLGDGHRRPLQPPRARSASMSQRGEAQVDRGPGAAVGDVRLLDDAPRVTQGRAVYTMQFPHYEEVPKAVAEQIITKNAGK